MLDGTLLDRQYLGFRALMKGCHHRQTPWSFRFQVSYKLVLLNPEGKVLWTSSRTKMSTAIVFAPPRRGIARKNIKIVSPGFFVAGFS